MPESVPTDITTATIQPFGLTATLCHEAEAPSSAVEKAVCMTSVVPYTEGMPGTLRHTLPGEDSGIITLLVISFFLVALGFKHCSRLFRTFTQDLWTVRRRANVFDDHTANETQVLISLIFQTCVYESLLLLASVGSTGTIAVENIFPVTLAFIGITGALYLFQLMTYGIIGYVFSDKTGTSQWIRGFNASQSLLGFTLIVPALFTIFYPTTSHAMLIVAVILYITARIVFICKGFRIFYHNFPSLLYFILYLCAVEIIPVIFAYSGAVFLSGIIQ